MSTVSVVVTCFNQEACISDTLASVSSQTLSNWECIVVDDGSTDASAAAISRHIAGDARFRLVSKPNGGVASARNLGFRHASAQLLVPLDGDDKLHPDFLRAVTERLNADPQVDLVHCLTRNFGAKSRSVRLPDYSYDKLLWQNMLVNTTAFRRAAFERSGGYSETMVHGFEDWEFYVRLLNPRSVVRRIDRELFLYRVKPRSRSTEQIESGRVEESMRQIYLRNRLAYAEHDANPIAVFARRMKDFAPSHTARYRRQIRYLHLIYLCMIAILLGLLMW